VRQRTFTAGQEFEAGGVRFRVQAGRKASGDLRLEWWINGEWVPVILDAVFAIVDFVAGNEDHLYRYPAKGGEEVLRYCRIARVSGWREASRLLHLARVNKVNRIEECLYSDGRKP
jgi:hypothetical protein